MQLPTVDELYPDHYDRPFRDDPKRRLAYLEKVMKHVLCLAGGDCNPDRVRETAEEALGWRKPYEASFALSEK